jgi:transposase-like protein
VKYKKRLSLTPSIEEPKKAAYEGLEVAVRMRAQEWIQDLMEAEVEEFLGRLKGERRGSRVDVQGYRNGHGKPRGFAMTNGTVRVRRPRTRGTADRFESKILPLFKRHTVELANTLPELYLHGLSKGDFELALRGLLGGAAPLSASSIGRLKEKWQAEYEEWKKRDLSHLEIVYQWADGLYVKAGIDDRKSALLVIIGADTKGKKHVLAMESGHRESGDSWKAVLRDLRARGLKSPRATCADGHLGIWSALAEIFPESAELRCWNHRIVNVLDKMAKSEQSVAAELLKAMPYSETKSECERLRDEFAAKYRKREPRAVECLEKDWARLTAFYDFPKEHWIHLRTTNIVESPFSGIRLRTEASRRFKKVENAVALIWKLMLVAEKHSWNKLQSADLLAGVFAGLVYRDGVRVVEEKTINKTTEKEAA